MTTATVPAHFDRNDPVIRIGIRSYFTAIDHGPNFDSFGCAIDAFAQEAFDSAIRTGLSSRDALAANDIVYALYRHNNFVC